MWTLEFHPRDGGADAESFAAELAHATGRHFGVPVDGAGKTKTLQCL